MRIRVAVEAGIKLGWEHYACIDGAVVDTESFGASAPASALYEKFSITPKCVEHLAREILKRVA